MILHPGVREKPKYGLSRVPGWAVWSIPGSARLFLFTVETLAAALTVGLLVTERPGNLVVLRFAVLLTLSVGYAEVSKRSERVRRYLGAGRPTPRSNPLSVWSFAALLLLPAGWAAAFIIGQYVHAIIQRRREQTSKPYRQVFVAAAAVLAQLAGAGVLAVTAPGGGLADNPAANLGVLAAAAVFTVVDLGLMTVGVWLAARPPTLRALLPEGDALSYEFASLGLGVASAETLLHTPWLAPIMIAPVAYIHRSSMLKALREMARTDCKTGLLNTTAWTEFARAALARCARTGRSSAVVIIDVDHFKAINDRRGHLVGDRVLSAVATTLRSELRGHDGIGRFGGDEFVVLLEEVGPEAAAQVAARLGAALAAIRVEDLTTGASIGMAHSDDHGGTLEPLLEAADGALYVAKARGRGQVCVAPASMR
jgi:diguanylate cyclase (GGDEF)-like protein